MFLNVLAASTGDSMSEFDFGFGNLGDVDTERGQAILAQFHDAMNYYYGSKYPLSFNELIGRYKPGIIEGIGLAANAAGLSTSSTETAMERLALAGNGRIPATWNGYIGALTSQAMPSAWQDVLESALNQGSEYFHEVADPAIDATQSLLTVAKLAPLLIYGTVALVAWSMWKNRDNAAEIVFTGAKGVAGAATGGLLNLGGAVTKAAIRKIGE